MMRLLYSECDRVQVRLLERLTSALSSLAEELARSSFALRERSVLWRDAATD
jgi:hypothetical protein